MSVSEKEFQFSTVPISDEVKESSAESCHAWIEPARFGLLHNFNDQSYLEAYWTPGMKP